jgi:hypothetical protein
VAFPGLSARVTGPVPEGQRTGRHRAAAGQ